MSHAQRTRFIWRAYKYKGTLATLELIERLLDVGPYTATVILAEMTNL